MTHDSKDTLIIFISIATTKWLARTRVFYFTSGQRLLSNVWDYPLTQQHYTEQEKDYNKLLQIERSCRSYCWIRVVRPSDGALPYHIAINRSRTTNSVIIVSENILILTISAFTWPISVFWHHLVEIRAINSASRADTTICAVKTMFKRSRRHKYYFKFFVRFSPYARLVVAELYATKPHYT